MTPDEALIQALMEAAALLSEARPPDSNPYSWEMLREAWMYRMRVRLMERDVTQRERIGAMGKPLPRESLEAAGFQPNWNVCQACKHVGGDHDLWNRCLECECQCFISMTEDEQWEYALSHDALRFLREVSPLPSLPGMPRHFASETPQGRPGS